MNRPTLCGALGQLVHELRLSAAVFHDYGNQHLRKSKGFVPTEEWKSRHEKAERNFARAKACEVALQQFETLSGQAALNALLEVKERAEVLRTAQRDYMADRGNSDKGIKVGAAALALDKALAKVPR